MVKQYQKMGKHWASRWGWIVVAVGVLIVVVGGCSAGKAVKKSTKKVIDDIWSSEKTYTKIVGYFPFEVHTLNADSQNTQGFGQRLDKAISRKCSGVIFVKAGDKKYPDFAKALADINVNQTGGLDRAKRIKPLGFNAIVRGNFVALGIRKKMRGYFMWKDSHSYLDMQLIVTTLDVETGAKLLEKVITRTVKLGLTSELDLGSDQEDKSKLLDSRVFQKQMKKLAKEVAEEVCTTVQKHPWRGHIRSVNGNTVVISSGKKAGISVGDHLAVIDLSKTIKSKQNEIFAIPGVRIGKISITSVSAHSAQAKIIEGTGIVAGSSLRPAAKKK